MKTQLVRSHIRQAVRLSADFAASQGLNQSTLLDTVSDGGFDHKVGNPDTDNCQDQQNSQREDGFSLHSGFKRSHVHKSVPPAASYSANLRGPLGKNSAPSGASDGKDGRGVSTTKKSNIDRTGFGIVRKGCNVRYYGAVGRVIKVRKGLAWVDWAGGLKGDYCGCAILTVVA